MGKAIPYDDRVKILRDHLSGLTHQAIADSLGYSKSGIKKLIRTYREKGQLAFKADYSACGKGSKSHFSPQIESDIMRRKEGLAGAPYVHSVLLAGHPTEHIPSVSAIQMRWKRAGGRPKKAGTKNLSRNTWTKEVHHTWQIDGKEQVEMGNKEQVSWVNIADEASSTALYTGLFPP